MSSHDSGSGRRDSEAGPIIDVRDVTKSFDTAHGAFRALQGVSLSIERGEMIAVTGKSGSGKSTLLNILTGIDRPSSGRVSVAGVSIASLPEGPLAAWRGRNIGIVFQFFQLLPTLTILENVILPMDFCNSLPRRERRERALSLLQRTGIPDQANKFPMALSGGEQQRAAIARALANDPPILVADEPTGNLDSRTADSIFQLFAELVGAGKTAVVVTHEKEFATYFQRSVTLLDGRILNGGSPATGYSI